MQILLLSNSTMKGEPYLGWPQPYLKSFLQNIEEVLFVPYAGITMSHADYTKSVSDALKASNTNVTGIHTVEDKINAIAEAQCIAVGGGNTFHLLASLQNENLMEPIANAVRSGTPYIGWSAGSNVACPTIMTTNDMPIIQPKSFDALNLIDFQVNAHYTTRTIPGHGGESRDLRIKELLEINRGMKVVGLPEGKLLELNNDQWYLKGIESEETLYFKHGNEAQVLQNGQVTL